MTTKSFMPTYARLLLITLLALVPYFVQSQGPDSVFKWPPVLRVGVPGDYAPFALAKGDSLSGSDIYMVRALSEALHVHLIFVKTSWPNLMRDMKDHKFDLAVGGISITPERLAIAPFSIPYHTGGKTFICLRQDSLRFLSPATINKPGIRLIVNKGGTNESVARAQFPLATLIVYPNNTGVFSEIIAGRADVMLTDDTEADLKARQYPQICRSFSGTIACYHKAIWVQNDKALISFINNWLQNNLKAGYIGHWFCQALSAD